MHISAFDFHFNRVDINCVTSYIYTIQCNQYNSSPIISIYMELIIFSFCWHFDRDIISTLVILEAIICGVVALGCIILKGVIIVLSISIHMQHMSYAEY